jgi:hypothetical protein
VDGYFIYATCSVKLLFYFTEGVGCKSQERMRGRSGVLDPRYFHSD